MKKIYLLFAVMIVLVGFFATTKAVEAGHGGFNPDACSFEFETFTYQRSSDIPPYIARAYEDSSNDEFLRIADTTNCTSNPYYYYDPGSQDNFGATNAAIVYPESDGADTGRIIFQGGHAPVGFSNIPIGNRAAYTAYFDDPANRPDEDAVDSSDAADGVDEGEPPAEEGGDQPVCEASGGFSWLICGAINLISDGVQLIAESVIQPLLEVQPVVREIDGQETVLYQVWSNILVIANALLVILFFVIIFAQASSFNIDAYTIKKALPRLVITAIAMQLSFYIVGFLVDITNVLGSGVASLLQAVTDQSSFSIEADGGEQALGTIAIVAAAAGVAGAILSGAILTGLLFLFFALLATFLILLFRQMFIIILIILAPIAFVLWVLPNTEKFFKMWWENLTKILLMYPLIMFLIGSGALLAPILGLAVDQGQQNSSSAAETLVEGVFGAATPVIAVFLIAAPLLLIPFTFKLAGAGMAAIGGMVQRGKKMGEGRALGDEKDPNSWRNRQKKRVQGNKAAMATGDRFGALGKITTKRGAAGVGGRVTGWVGGKALPGKAGTVAASVGSKSRGLALAQYQQGTTAAGKHLEELGLDKNGSVMRALATSKSGAQYAQVSSDILAAKQRDVADGKATQGELDALKGQLESGRAFAGQQAYMGAGLYKLAETGFDVDNEAFENTLGNFNNPAVKNHLKTQAAVAANKAGRKDIWAKQGPGQTPQRTLEGMGVKDWAEMKPKSLEDTDMQAALREVATDPQSHARATVRQVLSPISGISPAMRSKIQTALKNPQGGDQADDLYNQLVEEAKAQEAPPQTAPAQPPAQPPQPGGAAPQPPQQPPSPGTQGPRIIQPGDNDFNVPPGSRPGG